MWTGTTIEDLVRVVERVERNLETEARMREEVMRLVPAFVVTPGTQNAVPARMIGVA